MVMYHCYMNLYKPNLSFAPTSRVLTLKISPTYSSRQRTLPTFEPVLTHRIIYRIFRRNILRCKPVACDELIGWSVSSIRECS